MDQKPKEWTLEFFFTPNPTKEGESKKNMYITINITDTNAKDK